MMASDEAGFELLSKSIGPTRADESFRWRSWQRRRGCCSAAPGPRTLDPIAVLQRDQRLHTPR